MLGKLLHMRLEGSYAVKLVRDGYRNVATSLGIRFDALPPRDRGKALRKKLAEEVAEYLEDRSLSELADIYEVMRSLARVEHASSMDAVRRLADEKLRQRGSFMNGIAMFAEPVRPAGGPPSSP